MKIKDAFDNAVEHEPPEAGTLADAEAVALELAKLSILEYAKRRSAEAKKLGITVGFLDAAVEELRAKKMAISEPNSYFVDPVVWHQHVNGPDLLGELVLIFKKYIVLPKHSPEALALWCVHAHAHDAATVSAILALVSPEKRCGKTTTMKVISGLVPRPMPAVNITASVLFRVVEKFKPTVLVDEGDSFLKDSDEFRGILNGGHDRHSALVWRSVGDDHEPRPFNVWAPKAIAMIGRLPDTLEDRAVVVPLRRRRKGETVERLRVDQMEQFAELQSKMARWVADNFDAISERDPELPEELNDRARDNWHPLIAIADQAGGDWPEIARLAAVALSSEAVKDDDSLSAGVRLLRDIRDVMGPLESIASSELVHALHKIEDGPWSEWRRGNPITAARIARILRPFKVAPYRAKGGSMYRATDLQDAWDRYLDHPSSESLEQECEPATCDQGATKKTLKIKAKSQVADSCGPTKVAGGKCDKEVELTPDELKHHL